jgi:ribonuclease P protein component
VFARGKVVSCPGAKLFCLKNELPLNRIVFTLSRKYGNAVQRNYARRLSRESYRLIRDNLCTGFDLVLLVYPGRDSLLIRRKQLDELFSKMNMLMETK